MNATLANASVIRSQDVPPATMNAVVIYDDFACAPEAKAMLERAAHRVNEFLPWTFKTWQMEKLARPLIAEAALADTADAHMVVVSLCHDRALPGWVMDWLEQWAARRRVQDAAVAAWDGRNGDILQADAAPELSVFALRHGLSFLSSDADVMEPDFALLSSNMREGDALLTGSD